MLSLQHLTVSLGTRVVLRDVSLDLEPGDIVCIIGEEGSGKTTLLQLLTRARQPDEGAIKIDGAYLSQLPREVLRMYRRRIGYLHEQTTLDDTLTVEENIALPLDVTGTPTQERDRAVNDLLKRLRLTTIARMRPSTVSHGERRLAAVARTIVHGPVILLLDEPFQGLGHETTTLVANLLQNMQKKGATVIVTSADARTATYFKNPRIAHLHRGKLTEEVIASAPETAPTLIQAEDIARIATAELVERTMSPDTELTPTATPQRKEHVSGKKIRITSVSSL